MRPRTKSRLSPKPRSNAKFPQFFPLSQIHLIIAPPTPTHPPKLALRHYNPNYNECNNLNTVSSELGLSKRYPGDDVYVSNFHCLLRLKSNNFLPIIISFRMRHCSSYYSLLNHVNHLACRSRLCLHVLDMQTWHALEYIYECTEYIPYFLVSDR